MANSRKIRRLFTTPCCLLIGLCLLLVSLVCDHALFHDNNFIQNYRKSSMTWLKVFFPKLWRYLLGWHARACKSHCAVTFVEGRNSTRRYWRNDGGKTISNKNYKFLFVLMKWNWLLYFRPIWERPSNLMASGISWDVMFMTSEVI